MEYTAKVTDSGALHDEWTEVWRGGETSGNVVYSYAYDTGVAFTLGEGTIVSGDECRFTAKTVPTSRYPGEWNRAARRKARALRR